MMKVIFMGTPDFSVPILQRLLADGYNVCAVVTQPDRPKGRKKILTPPPVKVEAEKNGIPALQPEKIRNDYKEILDYKPDLIVTAAFGQILPEEILNAPTYGCINVHASFLPELRGGAPIHYAILQGKKETGVSIMYMVKELDAGDILSQVKVSIEEEDHVGSLHDKLSIAGADLLSETIPNLISGHITPVPQEDEKATFAYNIKRDQEKIDWKQTNEEVYNHIRGLHPWPVAFTILDGSVLKVWWGQKVNGPFQGKPGEIVDVLDEGLIVQTGDQKGILITELQPSGKKRMEAGEFLRGAGQFIRKGMRLGDST
ncbi:methionyl-tRNA formyltransferase [Bacillaceae bacterium S4-13-58]